MEAKETLIDYVNNETDAHMAYDVLTLGFARRATEYKRTNLLFSDMDKLEKIGAKGEIQIIFAGKAHPKDESGKKNDRTSLQPY